MNSAFTCGPRPIVESPAKKFRKSFCMPRSIVVFQRQIPPFTLPKRYSQKLASDERPLRRALGPRPEFSRPIEPTESTNPARSGRPSKACFDGIFCGNLGQNVSHRHVQEGVHCRSQSKGNSLFTSRNISSFLSINSQNRVSHLSAARRARLTQINR